MLYFLINKDSLSVYQKISPKKSLSIVGNVKFHSKLDSLKNNPKKLSSVIARALDEISEKIIFANKKAAIAIDDSLLFHSLTIKSKKFDNIDYQIEEENKNKWSEKCSEFYFASESRKGSKNIFHSVNINHFLREKIKLNFNNFGIRIVYFVPISSIIISKIKSSQYAVRKKGNVYHIFGFNKKSFNYYEACFAGKSKGVKTIISLGDTPKFKEKELMKNNLKFIHFNKTKILEFFSNIVEKKYIILNFAFSSGLQIFNGEVLNKKNQKTFKKPKIDLSYLKTPVAAITSFFVLIFILNSLSDYKFMEFEENVNNYDKEFQEEKPIELSLSDNAKVKSLTILNNFMRLLEEENVSKNESIEVNESTIDNNLNDKMILDDLTNFEVIELGNLIGNFFEVDNKLKYKIFDGIYLNNQAKNIVFRFEDFSNFKTISSQLSKLDNAYVRKITFNSSSNHLHIYISFVEK